MDPGALLLRTWLNGELRQEARTREMIFDVGEILAYISAVMTLEPGDVILTGTPEGVGQLKPGDVVEVEIEGDRRSQKWRGFRRLWRGLARAIML